jgi:RHS repeat-associated protein
MVRGADTFRLVTDHLGSVRLVVKVSDSSVAQRIDYDEWGVVTGDTSPGLQPFGFAGGLYDADTKLVRFGARDYEAETGRWLKKDPIGFDGGQANLYTYAGNDPVNNQDAQGTLDWSTCMRDCMREAVASPRMGAIAVGLYFGGIIRTACGYGAAAANAVGIVLCNNACMELLSPAPTKQTNMCGGSGSSPDPCDAGVPGGI